VKLEIAICLRHKVQFSACIKSCLVLRTLQFAKRSVQDSSSDIYYKICQS